MKEFISPKPLTYFSRLAALTAGLAAVAQPPAPTTPIRHVIVLFQENESFDHYYGTYPVASNPDGEPPFWAAPGTPTVNGLTAALLTNNPNAANPERLSRAQAHTKDMDHGYTAEQKSFHGGLMDKFVENNGRGDAVVMDYYDGNTVTAFWNYAQHFAMHDNFFGSNLGPSTPGAINVISGDDHGATVYSANQALHGKVLQPGDKGFPAKAVSATGTLYGDVDPYYDAASKGPTASLSGTNLGDLLNAKGLTWGCFFGGYADPSATHANIAGEKVTDYIPHHEPFEYYGATANVNHVRPSSADMIGRTDAANHQYDIADFWTAADAGNLPNYAFLKAPAYQDGHPAYSDPLDEQTWLVQAINRLEALPSWKDSAIFIAYDDSDGWYDHVMPPIVNQSNDPALDALEGKDAGTKPPLNGDLDRLGYGPRFPMVLVSPYARHNAVVSNLADQSSVLRFVEDNWNLGRIGNGSFDTMAGSLDPMFNFTPGYRNPPLFLDPESGEPVARVMPFHQGGQLFMALGDFAQSLDVVPRKAGHGVWFGYGPRLVQIPSSGHSVLIDGHSVELGAAITTRGKEVCLPVTSLAKALGVQPVEYKAGEILFRPLTTTGGLVSGLAKPAGNVQARLVLQNDAEREALTVSAPTAAKAPASFGILVGQTVDGTRSGHSYHLNVSATDASGAPLAAGSKIWVSFEPGQVDTTGTLSVKGQGIGAAPVAVALPSTGKAVLDYQVGVAPTNWDAYDNDAITISTAETPMAGVTTNQITVYNNVVDYDVSTAKD
jgi:phospholipase C